MKIRVGLGFDVHQLKDGLEFWIGGILVPYSKGGLGHSDADVLIHAICDACLGAANLGDIGRHFPDNSDKYKDIDSKILLREVIDLIHNNNFTISNIDSTICLQEPKISEYIPQMRRVLADCMKIDIQDISIKATTTEEVGFVGQKKGVSAYAIVLLHKD